jgi:xylan 1,4-beta-xylosidase
MDMGKQLRQIAGGFALVASYPELKQLPLIIGESDPEGCAACGMATNPENAYRNGTMYSSYTAASFARKYALADSLKINFKGAVSWSFEFENQPWFFGFRDLATNGVDKPVLNVFRMFGKMTGRRVRVTGTHMYPLPIVVNSSVREAHTDIGGLATKDKRTAAVMVWNYHDDDEKLDEVAHVTVQLQNLPAKNVTLTEYRIDSSHSNSFAVWKKMGSPQAPTAEQISELEKAGQLHTIGQVQKLAARSGKSTVQLSLPRQGVSLLKMDW